MHVVAVKGEQRVWADGHLPSFASAPASSAIRCQGANFITAGGRLRDRIGYGPSIFYRG